MLNKRLIIYKDLLPFNRRKKPMEKQAMYLKQEITEKEMQKINKYTGKCYPYNNQIKSE